MFEEKANQTKNSHIERNQANKTDQNMNSPNLRMVEFMSFSIS
jgi:hypothetical protein